MSPSPIVEALPLQWFRAWRHLRVVGGDCQASIRREKVVLHHQHIDTAVGDALVRHPARTGIETAVQLLCL